MLFSKPSPPGGGITTGDVTPFTLSTSSSSCNCGSGDPAIRPARVSTDVPDSLVVLSCVQGLGWLRWLWDLTVKAGSRFLPPCSSP